jgi:GTP cyclohydrolase II
MTNNPAKLEELTRHGVRVEERVPIEVLPNPANERYLAVKREQMGHLLGGRE